MKHETRSTKHETDQQVVLSEAKELGFLQSLRSFRMTRCGESISDSRLRQSFGGQVGFRISDFHQSKSRGFTLMEMVVSLGIFSVVMLLSVGALVSVQNAQIRSSDAQTVHDNIRFAMELMTKEIRQGRQYVGFSCASECAEMRFLKLISGVEKEIGYCVNAGKLVRFIASAPESQDCSSGAVLTADEATVEGILFYIRSQGDTSDGQARVTITMRVRSQSPSQKTPTTMDLQTTLVQRLRES